ncbi:NAD(P)-binding domain protein [Niveomyces insectorum RCEF 264]|uniref:NAD(P)-binding domain protein n=1 Tax=Niveomyces insectorum RCEF 264 TaxID=1081102 RepID=A0A167QS28_9HYPO|nr:NAD(P)-binding domain protein [Niveomyces insectorum RCEF 264]
MPLSTEDVLPPLPVGPAVAAAAAAGAGASQTAEFGAGTTGTVKAPPPPPPSANPPRIVIIGAGSRGRTYAEAIETSTNGVVVAVVEPDAYKRRHLGRKHIWGPQGRDEPAEGEAFADWPDFVAYERARRSAAAETSSEGRKDVPPGVDAAFICVLDELHRPVIEALADLGGLHIMCEKPLATTMDDCVAIYRALRRSSSELVFSIGHVLRYSPHNMLLRRLLLADRAIGDVLSVVHTEPVGWWHFTHSYVRGNWRRESRTAPSLLTKSCHDIDVLLWLLCSPPGYGYGYDDEAGGGGALGEAEETPHLPSTVSSSGSLQLFRKARKPVAAGAATNCLACPAEPDCKYSAQRIYVGDQLRGLGAGNRRWPVSIVVPDIEDVAVRGGPDAARDTLLQRLPDYGPATPAAEVAQRNWFGRCVFESDNDVCDEQVVVVTWDDDDKNTKGSGDGAGTHDSDPVADRLRHRGAKTATFHMVAHTTKICDRYTHVYGVHGELYADQNTITVEDFRDGSVTVHRPPIESHGHGGGDTGLTRQFVGAVDRVKNHGWPAARAQRAVIGCTLEEVVRSHALVFCAEAARLGKTVVDWPTWWAAEVEAKLAK